jgi:hypothetical protein
MTAVRVAAYVRSSWSHDAEWSLLQIASAFRRHRCDVVLMSEHDRDFHQHRWMDYQQACKVASTDGILLGSGIEHEDPDNVVHTPVYRGYRMIASISRCAPAYLELLRLAQAEGALQFRTPMAT